MLVESGFVQNQRVATVSPRINPQLIMPSTRLLLVVLIPLLAVAVRAADPARWEVWEGCRFEPAKYFDGDSFHIAHGRESVIVRLYFVDAPETDTGYGERLGAQAAYFRTNTAAVLRAGGSAKAFTASFLAKPFRVITCRRVAPGASRGERLYAMVERDGRRLDAALVEAGWARTTSEIAHYPDEVSGRRWFAHLRQVEAAAAQARRGVWASSGTLTERWIDQFKRLRDFGKPTPVPAPRRVNVNTASEAELQSLPGVGAKTAEEIVRARPIKDIDALDSLPGFGPKKIDALRELISF